MHEGLAKIYDFMTNRQTSCRRTADNYKNIRPVSFVRTQSFKKKYYFCFVHMRVHTAFVTHRKASHKLRGICFICVNH